MSAVIKSGRGYQKWVWFHLCFPLVTPLLKILRTGLLLTVAHVQQSRCGLAIRATPGIIERKPQKSKSENARHLWRQFGGRTSPVVHVARTPSQTRKGRCPEAEQSFGRCNIRIHTIILDLMLSRSTVVLLKLKMGKVWDGHLYIRYKAVARDVTNHVTTWIGAQLAAWFYGSLRGYSPVPHGLGVIRTCPLWRSKHHYYNRGENKDLEWITKKRFCTSSISKRDISYRKIS